MAPALILTAVPASNLLASANFFGEVECKFSEVLVTSALMIAFMATAYFFRGLIVSAVIFGLRVMEVLKPVITAALIIAGVASRADADEVYQRDCGCASGITNNGACWICSRESNPIIRGRVDVAKQVANGLGRCMAFHTLSQLMLRASAYEELGLARDDENICWDPEDPDHIREATEAHRIATECSARIH